MFDKTLTDSPSESDLFRSSGPDPPVGRVRLSDEFFDLIGNRRRRLCLEILHGMETKTIPLDSLTRRLAERESQGTEGEEVSSVADPEQEDRISISLYHLHLPKLEHYGLVEFDQRTKTIRYRASPRFEAAMGRTTTHVRLG